MKREYFLKTKRTAFSKWRKDDFETAKLLWGDPEVTKYICASGTFSDADIEARLKIETANEETHNIQYWPVFDRDTEELIGCCGLRPYNDGAYELGFHLRKRYWGEGYATETAEAVIDYAFSALGAKWLFAGHNPDNKASAAVLAKLGFEYIGDEFYEPTGRYHPSYRLKER